MVKIATALGCELTIGLRPPNGSIQPRVTENRRSHLRLFRTHHFHPSLAEALLILIMNPPPPKPELYPISPPYPAMHGSRICIDRGHSNSSGIIVCFERPLENLFGIRIDVTHPARIDFGASPANDERWEKCGEITVEYLCLLKGSILAIHPADSSNFQFRLAIPV